MNGEDRLNILFLESFYGGSHRYFADGLIRNSRHAYTLVTMKAQAWKWRIRASAIHFAHQVPDPAGFDLILTTDLISIADLKALWPGTSPPIALYFHENQLCYPGHPELDADPQFDIGTLTSALAADSLFFNSSFHMHAFAEALPAVISKIPKPRPKWIIDEVERKSAVIYPGCDLPEPTEGTGERTPGPARILWNHRWEYDKRPEDFFKILETLEEEGVEFEIVVLGGHYAQTPPLFAEARERFAGRILQWGWVESREEYLNWLARADVTLSTAIQENFGISAVEAMRMGCYPLFPRRLSYPEIVPDQYHHACLYGDMNQLGRKLIKLCRLINEGNPHWRKPIAGLSERMNRYAWENLRDQYDIQFVKAARGDHSDG